MGAGLVTDADEKNEVCEGNTEVCLQKVTTHVWGSGSGARKKGSFGKGSCQKCQFAS